jgi:hypothetical protein
MHKDRFGFRAGSPRVGAPTGVVTIKLRRLQRFQRAIERHLRHQQPLAELNRWQLADLHDVMAVFRKTPDFGGFVDLESSAFGTDWRFP